VIYHRFVPRGNPSQAFGVRGGRNQLALTAATSAFNEAFASPNNIRV